MAVCPDVWWEYENTLEHWHKDEMKSILKNHISLFSSGAEVSMEAALAPNLKF
jgi:hypothetical protein